MSKAEATPEAEAPEVPDAQVTTDVAPPKEVTPTFDMEEIFGNTKPYEELLKDAFEDLTGDEDVEEAPEAVADDEEADAADSEDAEAVEGEAADPVAEEKAEAKVETPSEPVIPDAVLSELRRRLPSTIEKPEDIYAQIDSFAEKAEMLDAYDAALGEAPEITDLVSRVLNGEDPLAAVKEVFKYAFGEPDKDEDPEGWAEWKVQDTLAKKARQESAAKAKEATVRQQKMIHQAKQNFDGFVRAHQLDEAAATEHARNFSKLFTGENGNRLRDEHDIVFKGFNHDRLLQEALDAQAAEYEAKLKTARNEGIEAANAKRKRRGDGLPRPASGKTSAPGDVMDKEAARWSDQDDMSWLFGKK